MKRPIVGIIMGSDSDLPVMREARDVLEAAGATCEMKILSAHRTPKAMMDYVQGAEGRGMKIIIAGAGGAAHLPGMAAALTPLPVIGVPIKSAAFSGLDSLLSIVQMPGGVPVATMAVNGAKNAGLLALRILALGDREFRLRLEEQRRLMEEQAAGKARRLEEEE